MAVKKSIQLDGQSRHGAVEIDVIFPNSVLAPEFEAGNSPGS